MFAIHTSSHQDPKACIVAVYYLRSVRHFVKAFKQKGDIINKEQVEQLEKYVIFPWVLVA
jgi:hypothetical protein